MKAWLLIISIFVIFTIVCSPALAISKLSLIAQYKSEMVPVTNPMVININYTTPPPTPTPTPYVTSWAIPTPVPSSVKSYFPSWFIPSSRVPPSIYPSPTPASTPSVLNTCPPDIPAGELHFYDRMRATDGTYLYGAVDDSGAKFRVGKGCPCNCTYYDLNAGWDVVKTAPCDSLFK
jgi:hypothetical protein